ncbi:MAG: hypothetical protein ACRCU1_01435 [Alsobacter sp.]|jgi:hypothetical protein|nr:hypothetical protein [Burkholderiales bacterium]
MSKGEKRGNKEAKKPKKVKAAPAPVATSLFTKGTPVTPARGKGSSK